MDNAQQRVHLYEALVTHGMLEENPEEEQGGAPGIGPDEYTDTYYEFDRTDEDMEEDRDTNEAPVEPPTDEAHQDHPAPPGNPVDEDRSLEAEVAALRQQKIAMEARVVQAEQERDEVIEEMTEMAQLVAQHFGI